MTKRELTAAINAIVREEQRYAHSLQERGDFGRAKLALAALQGVRGALKAVSAGGDDDYAERLLDAMAERKAEYVGLWDDEDGIGTSTFNRVIDEVEMAL